MDLKTVDKRNILVNFTITITHEVFFLEICDISYIHFHTFAQIHVRAQHWYSSYFIEIMVNARNVPSNFGYVFLKG